MNSIIYDEFTEVEIKLDSEPSGIINKRIQTPTIISEENLSNANISLMKEHSLLIQTSHHLEMNNIKY
jgi:hypothetical protein